MSLLELPGYQDGDYSTPVETAPPAPSYPFLAGGTADPYTRLTLRTYEVESLHWQTTAANRTSYSNLLLQSSDMTTSPWASTSAGAGSTATCTSASELAPDGSPSFRLQADAGGSTASDYSGWQQTLTGLSNPHAASAAVWLKSNTATNQIVRLAIGDTITNFSATPQWRRFTSTDDANAATTDLFQLLAYPYNDTTEVLDLLVALPQFDDQEAIGPYIPTTSAARTVSSPDLDDPAAPGYDPFAYLLRETPGDISPIGRRRLTRLYGRIPTAQVETGAIAISKPAFSQFAGWADANYLDKTLSGLGEANYLLRNGTYYNPEGLGEIYGPQVSASSVNNASDTRVTCTAHGVGSGEGVMVIRSGNIIYLTSSDISIIDVNTIDILGVNWGTAVANLSPHLRDYTAGTDRVRAQITTSFYLPGVTLDVATAADIPIINPKIDDEAFIDLVLSSSTGYQDYDASSFERWLDTPIYQQSVTAIDIGSL